MVIRRFDSHPTHRRSEGQGYFESTLQHWKYAVRTQHQIDHRNHCIVGTREIEGRKTVEPPVVSWDELAYRECQKVSESLVLYYYYLFLLYIQFF